MGVVCWSKDSGLNSKWTKKWSGFVASRTHACAAEKLNLVTKRVVWLKLQELCTYHHEKYVPRYCNMGVKCWWGFTQKNLNAKSRRPAEKNASPETCLHVGKLELFPRWRVVIRGSTESPFSTVISLHPSDPGSAVKNNLLDFSFSHVYFLRILLQHLLQCNAIDALNCS